MPAAILIVDDDPEAILLLGQIVAAEGSTRFATNAGDALRLALAHPPDLLLLTRAYRT